MPSVSPKQRRFMAIAAANKEFADKRGISQKVAKEFHEADLKEVEKTKQSGHSKSPFTEDELGKIGVKAIEKAAEAAHLANLKFNKKQGDDSQKPWSELSKEEKKVVMDGVRAVIHGQSPEELHDAWMRNKAKLGWKLGKVKDEKKKTHPSMVPYNKLPQSEKDKDHLFHSVVMKSLKTSM